MNEILDKSLEELRVLVSELGVRLAKPQVDNPKWWFRLHEDLKALIMWYADWDES